jgi:hypothetical protein
VLVLQGPPGCSKARLIHAILREKSLRNDGHEFATAVYSCDKCAWVADEIFLEVITGHHDAPLIENAAYWDRHHGER